MRQSPHILVLKDGKQGHLGTFDEITEEGFNVDEILQQYGEVGNIKDVNNQEKDEDAIPLTIGQ